LFFGVAVVGGIAAAICTTSWLRAVHGSLAVGAMVAVGTVVWATASLQNATLAALGRARWMPAVNVALSLGKIALLPVLATTLSWHPVELSAVIAAAVVMLVMRRANSSAKNGLPPDISAIRTIVGRENVRPSRVEIDACNPPRLTGPTRIRSSRHAVDRMRALPEVNRLNKSVPARRRPCHRHHMASLRRRGLPVACAPTATHLRPVSDGVGRFPADAAER
jgi:hypothetical protein